MKTYASAHTQNTQLMHKIVDGSAATNTNNNVR